MASISTILECAIQDLVITEPTKMYSNYTFTFTLEDALANINLTPQQVIKWQLEITEYIYAVYKKGYGCSRAIKPANIFMDDNDSVLKDTIAIDAIIYADAYEALVTNSIIATHEVMFKYINKNLLNKKYAKELTLLNMFGNYFYASAVLDTHRGSVKRLFEAVVLLNEMVDSGITESMVDIFGN